VLLAPDKFKGTLEAAGAAYCLTDGLRRAAPRLDIRTVRIAEVCGLRRLSADRWRAAGLAEAHVLLDLGPDRACVRSPALTARPLEHLGHGLATEPPPSHAGSPPA
jgi:hypothetical protein